MFLVFDWWLDVIWLKSHRNATNCIDFNIVIRILNTPVSAKMAQGQRKWHVVVTFSWLVPWRCLVPWWALCLLFARLHRAKSEPTGDMSVWCWRREIWPGLYNINICLYTAYFRYQPCYLQISLRWLQCFIVVTSTYLFMNFDLNVLTNILQMCSWYIYLQYTVYAAEFTPHLLGVWSCLFTCSRHCVNNRFKCNSFLQRILVCFACVKMSPTAQFAMTQAGSGKWRIYDKLLPELVINQLIDELIRHQFSSTLTKCIASLWSESNHISSSLKMDKFILHEWCFTCPMHVRKIACC